MNIIESDIKGVVEIIPDIYEDQRGSFLELYNKQTTDLKGTPIEFVQDNLSYSKENVLRGLHFQKNYPQAKLVTCLMGEIFDVAVDLRKDSETFGLYVSFLVSSTKKNLVYIPEGFAHGFCVTSSEALVMYKCSEFYKPKDDYGLRYDDASISIEWPITQPILSNKDIQLPDLEYLSSKGLLF